MTVLQYICLLVILTFMVICLIIVTAQQSNINRWEKKCHELSGMVVYQSDEPICIKVDRIKI